MTQAYAVVVDGRIEPRTVFSTERGAKVNGLVVLCKTMVYEEHTDEDINRMWDEAISRNNARMSVQPIEMHVSKQLTSQWND